MQLPELTEYGLYAGLAFFLVGMLDYAAKARFIFPALDRQYRDRLMHDPRATNSPRLLRQIFVVCDFIILPVIGFFLGPFFRDMFSV